MFGKQEMFRQSSAKAQVKEGERRSSKAAVFIAEVVANALLMFFGCMGCLTQMVDEEIIPQWSGLTLGLTIMTLVQTIGHISGAYLHPLITLGAVILGELELILMPLYIMAQILGTFIGFTAIWVLTPAEYRSGMCLTKVHSKLTVYQGLFVEVIITGILLVACGAVWDARNSKNTDPTPIRFGLIVAVITMVADPYTGASTNPARSLVPAVFSNSWSNHWIYWVGPIIGAVIGATFYRIALNSINTIKSTCTYSLKNRL